MAVYRFYTIDPGGHIAGPPMVDEYVHDDAEAIQKAKALQDGKDIEIWEGDRVVAYLVPDRK